MGMVLGPFRRISTCPSRIRQIEHRAIFQLQVHKTEVSELMPNPVIEVEERTLRSEARGGAVRIARPPLYAELPQSHALDDHQPAIRQHRPRERRASNNQPRERASERRAGGNGIRDSFLVGSTAVGRQGEDGGRTPGRNLLARSPIPFPPPSVRPRATELHGGGPRYFV